MGNEEQLRGTPTLGILTGISYVSGLDYFKGINEIVLANTPKCHLMSPNPPVVMVSIDCDEYVHYLTLKSFARVTEHLLAGVRKLVAAGCDILVIASNTGHICVPAVESAFPKLEILHIADCCAFQAKKGGFSKVGLIGTKPTMEEDYLKSRLLQHGITTLVPEEEGTQEEIYEIIYQELSYNVFRDESRTKMVRAIRGLEARGAEAFGMYRDRAVSAARTHPKFTFTSLGTNSHSDRCERAVGKSKAGRRITARPQVSLLPPP
jgi:aspartate racemase